MRGLPGEQVRYSVDSKHFDRTKCADPKLDLTDASLVGATDKFFTSARIIFIGMKSGP